MGGPPKHFFLTLSHVHSFGLAHHVFFSQLEKEKKKKKKKKKGEFDILISYCFQEFHEVS
jgi:hypothetical protein